MHSLPHHYEAHIVGGPKGPLVTNAKELPVLEVNAPIEFDGAGDCWSPEDLLVAVVGDCFILTFRAVATASKFEWSKLVVTVGGKLDKADKGLQFTEFTIKATITTTAGVDEDMAKKLLHKAERNCLITSSLKASVQFECAVETE